MSRGRIWVPLTLLIVAAVIAGCGSAHKAATTRTPSASTRNEAASKCRANIASQSKLSASSKQALEAICAAAAGGSARTVRSQEARACRALVHSTVPPAYQPRALASCPRP